MARAFLTRRIRFAAAHRYHRPDWDEARNQAVFGACANPHFHGHTYTCDVTVAGEIDRETGMIVDLGRLDAILAAEVHARFDHRNINREVEEFSDGRLIPTGENLARFIYERLQQALGSSVEVTEVHLAEDESLSATYRGG